MNYELFIGLRYLRARRSETFISLITVISVLGVMIGVMTLNVVMAVMTGFEETLRDRLLGINAHVALVKSGDQLRDYEQLLERVQRENGVVAAAPTIYGQVMLTSGPRVSGVFVRGVDPDRVNRVVDIEKYIKEGSLQELKKPQAIQVEGRTVLLPGVILGVRLAGLSAREPHRHRCDSEGSTVRGRGHFRFRHERDRLDAGLHELGRRAEVLRARRRGYQYRSPSSGRLSSENGRG
ncbi:MAG: ABC transporter permease [Deltaproteobacteria bacterium]|nr:ABC transporter permease [Deltaproteobacteria bacterium]